MEHVGTRHRRTAGQGGRLAACLAALALAAGGCTSPRDWVRNGFKVGPNYCRPPVPAADQWIDAADVRVRSEPADTRRWWAVFNDPALNGLVQNAYLQNLTLREAGYRVLEARFQRAAVVGNFFPQTQQATADFTQNVLSKNIANRQFVTQRWFPIWATGFNLAWELDFWGRFRRAIEAATAQLDASVESYDDVLVTLLADVAEAYVQLRTAQTRIELARKNVELQRGTLQIAVDRFQLGATTELDVEQAKTNVAQTEALIPPLETTARQANNQLCILLGLPPRDLRAELGLAPIPSAPPAVALGIPADLIRRRPDVRRAERDLAAQSANIGVATAELYPHISITGSIAVQASQFPKLFENDSLAGSIGPSVTWNVLNYGRLLSNIGVQDARFQELVAHYQQQVLTANQEVENGIVSFLKAQEQARFLAEAVAAARKSVDLSLEQFRLGKVDFNRVFVLETTLVQQQDQFAQAQGSVAQGLIQVYRALGGGWQIRCPPTDVAATPDGRPAEPVEQLPAPQPDVGKGEAKKE